MAGHQSRYQASLKSLDTEEHIDLMFYRPLGYMWACLAARLGISPNAITIAAIFLGIGAGIAFYFSNLWINVIGILLLVWANSFDSADGQLARMTGRYSRWGRVLDGLCGDIWFGTIYIAICLRETNATPFFSAHPWLIWLLAAVAGLCHARQAAMADYYRQFHLYFLKGEEGSELDSSVILRRRYEAITWRKNFFSKLTIGFYLRYTENQERITPAMQRLQAALRRVFPSGVPSEEFRKAFRSQSLPLMKYTNILSFNWRAITLFASILAGMPWLYFVIELVVFNAILIYMVRRHESMCRRLLAALNDGQLR